MKIHDLTEMRDIYAIITLEDAGGIQNLICDLRVVTVRLLYPTGDKLTGQLTSECFALCHEKREWKPS